MHHYWVFGSIDVFVALSAPTVPTVAVLPIFDAICAMHEFIRDPCPGGRPTSLTDWLADLVGSSLYCAWPACASFTPLFRTAIKPDKKAAPGFLVGRTDSTIHRERRR